MLMPKRTKRDTGLPELPLGAREIRDHLLVTDDQVTAWFRLGPQPWQWRGDDYRNRHLRSAQTAWAALAGHDVHMRVTARPYPAHRWARAMRDITPDPANPGAFGQYLTDTQRHLRTSSQADGEVYIGVSLGGDRKAADRLASTLKKGRIGDRERTRLQQQIDEVVEIVAMPGIGARPVRQDELVWLMHRSIGLGLPEPVDLSVPTGTLGGDDLAGLHDSVDVDPRPFKRTIEIAGHPHRNGHVDDGTGHTKALTRHVAVLSLGRMESFTVPELHDPWVAFAERLPFAVEWSLRFRIVDGTDAADDMKKRLDAVDDQTEQYRTHRIALPPRLTRLRETATAVRDTMEEGTAVVAARFDGYFDVAVWGRTETEAMDNARSLTNLYKPVNVSVEHPPGQHGLYRAFIPGESRSTTAHRHRGEVAYIAAAVPHLASRVGDRRGGYLGWTNSTSRRACMYDPHFGIEVRERSGLTPVIGGLGAGKSTLMGAIAYLTALRGIPTTILDPSGPLARLCYMPEFAGRARHVDLLKSAPGTLAPYTAIPTPTRAQVAEDERLTGTRGQEYDLLFEELYVDAVHQAERTRMTLAIDVLRLLLPPGYREARGPMNIIRDAVRCVGGHYTASLGSVLGVIKADPRDEDHEVYKLLHDMSESPQSRLFFGSGYMAERSAGPTGDEVLLVLTMPGLSLPDEKIPEANWSEQERIAVPLLTLAAHYATRRIYSRSMKERKLVAMDEAHFLRGIPTGRALVDRLARDSRKWTTRVMVATQKCADLDQLSARGLVRELFLGRIEDAEEARAALTLAGIPTGVGYEAQLADLSPDDPTVEDDDQGASYREFVMRDVDGNVERVRIDLDHQPELFAVLRTRRRTDPTQVLTARAVESLAGDGAAGLTKEWSTA